MSPATDPAPDSRPVIVDARRTPIGTAGRSLAALTAVDLAAPVLAALAEGLDPTGLPVAELGDVVLGNCMG
ncbi:MAG TPA: hypothetical protein VJ819_06005, partial [Nocardioidaceae bacterium]|nr:hypothetical protein [Nocardioidaceae bacterium]